MNSARRPLFFLAVAAICLLLLAPTPATYRWVNISMAALALFWSATLTIEWISAHRRRDITGGNR